MEEEGNENLRGMRRREEYESQYYSFMWLPYLHCYCRNFIPNNVFPFNDVGPNSTKTTSIVLHLFHTLICYV
jgi:hypothetical protein